jgi:putative flavoprotein involved in K+ transport
MSCHLARLGREHVVLERARVAERWRTERWDSLAFQFPNWMMRLPGYAYEGNDPEGFMHRNGVVRFISDYAKRIAAPLRCGIRVTALWQLAGTEKLLVETDQFNLEASNVVVATGPYQVASVPSCGATIPTSTHQTTANRYTNPDDLPAGAVLVVGSGASGYQIAEDLLHSGRDVYLSVGRHRRVPRRYRGRDFGWWQEMTGLSERSTDTLPPDFLPPLLTGVNGGQDVDLRKIAREGATLLGSLRGVEEGRLFFASDLETNLAKGDEGVLEFTRIVDEFIARQGMEVPQDPLVESKPAVSKAPVPELDIHISRIRSVIWATGYRYDFRWIDCPVLDKNGKPKQRRGVTSVPGLYFLGLPRLHKVKSSFLWGVGEDAGYLAGRIATRARAGDDALEEF